MTKDERKELADLRAMRERILALSAPDACERAYRKWEAAGYPSGTAYLNNPDPLDQPAPPLSVVRGTATTTEPTRRGTLRLDS